MDPLSIVGIIALAIFLSMCAFYSATETAFASLNKYKFKVQAEDGSKTAALIVRFYDHFDSTLITVLIGNNIFAVGLSSVSTLLFLKLFNGVLNDDLVSLIASLTMAVLVFLFGDTIPKFIGKRRPDAVVKFSVYPLAFFFGLFYPLTLIFRGLNFLFKKMFKTKAEPELTKEDFLNTVEEIEEADEIEENESEIIQASLKFSDLMVKQVLTPAKKMAMLDTKGLSSAQLIDYIKTCPYSRIPMYYGKVDNIVGILVVKNYLSDYFSNPKTPYLNYLQKPYFVNPSIHLDDLLDGFQKRKTQIAIVRKEGRLIGMVTAEDALEELVGSIAEKEKGGRK